MLQLPVELVLNIVKCVDGLSDLAHFGQTCRGLSYFFFDELYSRDVRDWNSSALLWACQNGNLATAQRSIDAGASVNHLFFETLATHGKDMAAWAPWLERDGTRVAFLPGHPLGVAIQYRRAAMVRFLLEKGANPNQHDGAAVGQHGGHIWYPIHWAMSCQTNQWQHYCCAARRNHLHDSSGSSSSSGCASPSLEIIALLLQHGANPNQPTRAGPRRRCSEDDAAARDTFFWGTMRPIHAADCDHVGAEALRLLLEAGADPRARSACFACTQPDPATAAMNARRVVRTTTTATTMPTLFQFLEPLGPFVSDVREAKMLLLARHQQRGPRDRGRGEEEDRRHPFLGRFTGFDVASTLQVLTPSRLKLLLFLIAGGGGEGGEEKNQKAKQQQPTVLGSGIYAALDAWSRQKEAAQDPSSEDPAYQAEVLGLLESFIARLVGVRRIEYADEAVLIERERELSSGTTTTAAAAAAAAVTRTRRRTELVEAFRSFCEKAQDSDVSPFVRVLAEHGIHRQHEGRQLTLSEVIERRMVPKARSLRELWSAQP